MHVIVVGGGISGLAAAHRLLEDGASVTLLEASARLGGKLLPGDIAGSAAVDLGAESMLARRPEGVDLARDVGLGDDLVSPTTARAAIRTGGALRPMPTGHVMGVPADPAALRGVLSPEGLARAAQDTALPRTPVGEDVAIGVYVADRLGPEVVDRMVDPLLGGVYAGDPYRLSMRAAVPKLYEAARAERSLLAGVQALQRRAAESGENTGPVFAGIDGGIGRLPAAVADACRRAGADLRTGVPVTALRRVPPGADGAADTGRAWHAELDTGQTLTADGVVLAVPAPAASRLLARAAPAAASALGTVPYASMALVTLAFRRSDLAQEPPGSGFLVPPSEGLTVKAATFSAAKWAWTAEQDPDLYVLRTSIGRRGEEHRLRHDDAELVAASRTDLRTAAGVTARPVDSRVTRWDGGLPQYEIGHLERIAGVRRELAALPGLALCGAACDGVGIPACIGGARRAVEETLLAPAPGGRARMGA